MMKQKTEVECRTMVNKVQFNAMKETRTVYCRKDGTMYCVVMSRKIPVQKDETGTLFYEWHYRTVGINDASSVLKMMDI